MADRRLILFNLDHDPEHALAWTGDRLRLAVDREGVQLAADLSPELPLLNRALESVKSGKRTGLSIEFKAIQEHQESGLRVIEKAQLFGVGLVRDPSYESSRVEARAKGGLRSSISYGKRKYCECQKGSCEDALFEEGAFSTYTKGNSHGEVLAVMGSYDTAFASTKRGTLKFEDGEDGLEILIAKEALESPNGKRLTELLQSVDVKARPLIDQERSTAILKDVDGVATTIYSTAILRGILYRPVTGDRSSDWPTVTLDKAPEKRVIQPPAPAGRRRIWL